jgi:hypothetical protein
VSQSVIDSSPRALYSPCQRAHLRVVIMQLVNAKDSGRYPGPMGAVDIAMVTEQGAEVSVTAVLTKSGSKTITFTALSENYRLHGRILRQHACFSVPAGAVTVTRTHSTNFLSSFWFPAVRVGNQISLSYHCIQVSENREDDQYKIKMTVTRGAAPAPDADLENQDPNGLGSVVPVVSAPARHHNAFLGPQAPTLAGGMKAAVSPGRRRTKVCICFVHYVCSPNLGFVSSCVARLRNQRNVHVSIKHFDPLQLHKLSILYVCVSLASFRAHSVRLAAFPSLSRSAAAATTSPTMKRRQRRRAALKSTVRGTRHAVCGAGRGMKNMWRRLAW